MFALRGPATPIPSTETLHKAQSLANSYAGSHQAIANTNSYCDEYPGNDTIAAIVKTGATEALIRLPTQLVASLRCVKEPIIVSDLEQTLGRHRIHDVLANIAPEDKDANPDFDIYRKQREYATSGQRIKLHSLSSLPVVGDDWRTKGKSAAWGLDKYKFLHMVEKAWELQPEREWYVFIEADTYLSWRNLLGFLGKYDSQKPWYFGDPVLMHEHKPTILQFAHAGSGFILSGSLVRDWVVNHAGLANRWDKRIPEMWFGGYVMADALDEELKVTVTDVTPMMQRENPARVPFGADVWCKPVVTLHHLDSRQFNELYQTEMALGTSQLLFRDVYHSAYLAGLPFRRDDWYNLADDHKFAIDVTPNDMGKFDGQWEPKDLMDPHQSYMGCELACIQNERCFQFAFSTTAANEESSSKSECWLSIGLSADLGQRMEER
ncbi:hypothetical protein LTR36_008019 [Oleoguttula mirabilis]|uniref:N-acetylgalactosaminide beta-1,3-galactosyltransferase n=1 Tax=Oleoguttula mirabilis TaxID=1507867 RepID=A0AAV9J9J3_9PEZI|nr:hypothetical protein LTR36_008019 [Oleoguttula mirabilis]